MQRVWWAGVWMVIVGCATSGSGCSGDSDTDDTDGDDDDDTDNDTDTDVPVECTGPTSGPDLERVDTILCLEGDLAAGETFYDMNCSLCHLDDGTGVDGGGTGANLTLSNLSEDNVIATVLIGIPYSDMDAYHHYQNQQLADVTTYVMETFIND